MTRPTTGPATVIGIASDMAPDGSRVVHVQLETVRHRFLRDHVVNGRPLLSTVMGIETIACAVAAARPGCVIAAMTDVKVGPPYFVGAHGNGSVDVTVSAGSTAHCEVRTGGTVHYRAAVELGAPPPTPDLRVAHAGAGARSIGSDEIYALFFHGESFRVVGSASLHDGVMLGRLARGLPPIVDHPTQSRMAPLLIELCLQTAGLWELAALDAMMIPRSIDRMTRFTDVDSGSGVGLTAVVTPRADHAGRYCFDATVVDDTGRAHVDVQGYRSIEFSHPYDRAAAERIRDALGPAPVP